MESVDGNCDIEILSLIIGLGRAARVTQISQESIQKMLAKLRPEKLKFCTFIKDCLLRLINQIGSAEASKKLNISEPVLKSIVKYSSVNIRGLRPLVPLPSEQTSKITEANFKVFEFYKACKCINKTAKNFGLSREKVINILVNCAECND